MVGAIATSDSWTRVAQLGRGLEPLLGARPQHPADQRVEPRQRRIELGRLAMLALHHHAGQGPVVGVVADLVETLAGQQLEQHRADRVEIGAGVDHAAAHELLRRHVAELAEAHLGIGGGRAQRALGDAEVDDLGLALERHQDVGRRDIAVDQPQRLALGVGAAVGIGQAVGHLAGDEQRDRRRDAAALARGHGQEPPQIAALEVLEGEEVLVADPADLEHLGDVDVLQLDRDLRLVDEPRDELRVLGQARQHLLDHAQLLEAGQAVLGEEDLAHAAARQPLDQEVAAEHRGQPDVGQPRPGGVDRRRPGRVGLDYDRHDGSGRCPSGRR
jgi:hypothetical protein